MSGDGRPKRTVANADPSPGEVEELLRAAQDDLLLSLSVDAHTTSSPSSLDPDLSRRFDALRSHHASAAAPPKREPTDGPSNLRDGGGGGGGGGAPASDTSAAVDGARGGRGGGEGEDEVSKILGDDLAARFAALKGASSSYLPPGSVARKPERIPKEDDDDGDVDESDDDDDGDGVSKKEVEKLMQWAMDAARLDPGNSDDEEGIGKEEEGIGGESELDDATARAGEKKKKAEGGKPPARKWFFF